MLSCVTTLPVIVRPLAKKLHPITISHSGLSKLDELVPSSSPPPVLLEEDIKFDNMIMDSMDPVTAAMADNTLSFNVNFDVLPSPLPLTMTLDKAAAEDCLNTPVTTSEMPSFFGLHDPDPPPITGEMLLPTKEKNEKYEIWQNKM